MSEESKLKADLAYAVDHIAKLTDFAIWMTGCCEMTQYDYFIKNRHLLNEPPIFVKAGKQHFEDKERRDEDKITEIINDWNESLFKASSSNCYPEGLAKQIRQQIGRELHVELTKAVIDNPLVGSAFGVNIGLEKAAIIASKVCKLEEE